VAVAVILVVGAGLSACGTSLAKSVSDPASTTSAPTTTTTTAPPAVAVAFPVVECTATTGQSLGGQGWKPSILLAPIPTALVGKVEFYSDSLHTVVGPTGWTCSQLQTSDGTTGLVVYPAGNPNPPTSGPAAPGTEGIFATFGATGNVAGISLVCPFFAVAGWQQKEAKCPTSLPKGEQSSMPTPDVASVTDPAGVVGTLEGSGGSEPVTGTVVFPQTEPAVIEGASVNVAEESCSLPDPSLCTAVLSDFDVREFPVPGTSAAAPGSSGSGARSYVPTATTPTSRPAVVTPTTPTTPATPTTPTTPPSHPTTTVTTHPTTG
jgi:hypothetical protein